MAKTVTRRSMTCEAVLADRSRRAVLAGLGVLAVAAPMAAGFRTFRGRSDGTRPVAIRDLVDTNGRATPMAVASQGKRLTLSGYFAPGLRAPAHFDLYERSTALCLLCGMMHDPGPSIAVRGAVTPKGLPTYSLVDVTGIVSLTDAGAITLMC